MSGGAFSGPSEDAGVALPNPWLTTVAIMVGTMMVYLDTTVVNLSLPYMAGSLSVTPNEATWSLTSYLAANAVILPISGWLANLVGRRRVILSGLSGFILSSLACGLATSLPLLVIFRVAQGLAGGVLGPLSQAVILESFPHESRGKAMGFWSAGIVLAPVLGPLVGGYLTENHSWRWVFLINLPVGIVALLLVSLFVVDPPYLRRGIERIDAVGILLLVLGIGGLQVMLDKGQEEDWFDSRLIVALLVIGLLSLLVFVLRSFRAPHSVVDLKVFRDRTFAIGTLLSAQVGFLLFGSIVVLPLLLQSELGYPPLRAGLLIAPRGLGALVAFPLVGFLTDRYDSRRLLALGFVIGAVTMYWFSTLSGDLGPRDLLAPQIIQGVALGLLFVPLSTITMQSVPLPQMGNATSVYNVLRNFGSSVGIAVVATYLVRRRSYHYDLLREHIDGYGTTTAVGLENLRAALGAGGFEGGAGDQLALVELARLVDSQAGILAFLDTFRIFALLFVLMIPFVFFMKVVEPDAGPGEPTKAEPARPSPVVSMEL